MQRILSNVLNKAVSILVMRYTGYAYDTAHSKDLVPVMKSIRQL